VVAAALHAIEVEAARLARGPEAARLAGAGQRRQPLLRELAVVAAHVRAGRAVVFDAAVDAAGAAIGAGRAVAGRAARSARIGARDAPGGGAERDRGQAGIAGRARALRA